jgi:hypothetical protein
MPPDPNCFIQPFGICIAQTNAVSGAFVAAIAALVTTFLKLFYDLRESKQRRKFEVSERKAREKFEQDQSQRQKEFEANEAREAGNRAADIQRKLQDYVQLGKWREASWVEKKVLIDTALKQFATASSGLCAVIEYGPVYDDLKMIKETAKVLDVFGDFQTSVAHRSLPSEIQAQASDLISHTTKILLTLSPVQAVRGQPERRATLENLKTELLAREASFNSLCAEFEHNPRRFDPPSDAA